MSNTITEVCKTHGHSFVESSIGKGPEPSQSVTLFCQKCGEVRTVKAEK